MGARSMEGLMMMMRTERFLSRACPFHCIGTVNAGRRS